MSEERTEIVVRLRRSYWHDNDGAYIRTSIRYLRRRIKGFNIFDDDCSMVGAADVIAKIKNLEESKDGIYRLITVPHAADYWSGHVEEWDYKLVSL